MADMEKMASLGPMLRGKFQQYEKDRLPVEQQWLKNLRQYMRQYDPDIKAKLKPDRSQAYPGDTRVKVKGQVAKMMEMMFPAQERNWELGASPIPSIPKKDLDQIILQLETIEMVTAQEEQRQPQPVRAELIERAVRAFADERKNAMEMEIADQLADPQTDYVQMMKRAVRSGTLYGCGLVRCPQVRTQKVRDFVQDPATGRWEEKTSTKRRPYPEFVRCWDFYPDLSARTWEAQEGGFERVVVNRYDFEQFTKRPDFKKEAILKYLKEHKEGNFVQKTFESELSQIAEDTNLINRGSRRYELFRWLGFVSGHDLHESGVEVDEDDLGLTHFADVWIIDDVVIKAELAAFGDRLSDVYHAYIPAEDEDSGLTGVGLPEDVRDSQMGICASTRALYDNMAATCGPILEVNKDLLPSGRKSIGSIHAFMTIEREGQGAEASAKAVNAIFIPSRIAEIMSILDMQRKQMDIESNLPSWTMGNPEQLGEAFRTSTNMSAMTGGANMTTKDCVRAFDKLTTGVIGSMLRWNMEFNADEDLKGDFEVRAKGNISLVSKEVRGAALEQFFANMNPEDRAMFDIYGLNLDRLKARDLPTDRLLPREEAMAAVAVMQQAQAQAAQTEQELTSAKAAKETAQAQKLAASIPGAEQTTQAQIQEILSRVEANLAQAKSQKDKSQLESMKLLLEGAMTNVQSKRG